MSIWRYHLMKCRKSREEPGWSAKSCLLFRPVPCEMPIKDSSRPTKWAIVYLSLEHKEKTEVQIWASTYSPFSSPHPGQELVPPGGITAAYLPACLPFVARTKSIVCSRQMHPLEAKFCSFLSLN